MESKFFIVPKWSLHARHMEFELCWNIWIQMEVRKLPGAIFGRCSSHAFGEIGLHSFPEHQTKSSLFDPRFLLLHLRTKHYEQVKNRIAVRPFFDFHISGWDLHNSVKNAPNCKDTHSAQHRGEGGPGNPRMLFDFADFLSIHFGRFFELWR